jgi:acyl-coenzyme A synthetase/AMP-(fatty) acid ligase
VTHGGVLRLVKGVSYVNFSGDDAVLQFASLTFDAATFEIWGCLLNGAKLVIHPPGMPSLDELGAFIKKAGITFLFLTTSLLRQMMERNAADLKAVRQLTTGGEAMPVALAKALWKELPRTRIVNMYGPTECTTVASSYTITNAEALGDSVPIGKPIENTSIFILDKYGNSVPVGVPGEIYIGGDGVCQGYWNRPELTALSFVPDSFGATPGGKLYRTGDIGKYREDGNILFMGRRDRQVKLSGYRIELAEVEAAIASHPAVSGVAVILAVDGDKRLSAFIELLPDQRLTLVELREYLSERLPFYMIPAQLEILDKLPLTTSGKVNYQGLARREDSPASTQNGHVAPRTAIEKQLAGIWKQILYAESIGVTDDFFDLGGQSLVATRLLSRVREMFQAEVTMRQFFDNPTIAGLASILSQDERQVKRAELLLALDGFRQEQADFTTLPADTTS